MNPALGVSALTTAAAVVVSAGFQPPIERGVPYVSAGTSDQVLDYYPPAAGSQFPAVLFIHGGSLQEAGERRTSPVYARVCEPFVAAGIACATMDYRLAPTHTWPAMPHDVAAAVRWLKAAVKRLGGDGRVFVFGHSSGCHLAAIVGANPKHLATVGLQPSDLSGVIAMGCILAPTEEATSHHPIDELRQRWPTRGDIATYGTIEDWLDSDPSRFIGPHVPATLVMLAESERFFPAILEQGARFVRRLLEINRPADLVIVPGRHMTSIANLHVAGDPTFAAIKRFIDRPDTTKRPTRQES